MRSITFLVFTSYCSICDTVGEFVRSRRRLLSVRTPGITSVPNRCKDERRKRVLPEGGLTLWGLPMGHFVLLLKVKHEPEGESRKDTVVSLVDHSVSKESGPGESTKEGVVVLQSRVVRSKQSGPGGELLRVNVPPSCPRTLGYLKPQTS